MSPLSLSDTKKSQARSSLFLLEPSSTTPKETLDKSWSMTIELRYTEEELNPYKIFAETQ